MLYFTRLDRKPSVGMHQTQFYCQNPRRELDVRTGLVGISTVGENWTPFFAASNRNHLPLLLMLYADITDSLSLSLNSKSGVAELDWQK